MLLFALAMLATAGCDTHKNTARNRWWHSFNARYNTYYNGSVAFIDGAQEKENGNKDNFTEIIPLYTVSNKNSRDLGKGQFDRAIEKMEKVIKQHSVKGRPEWTKNRRKTPKDIEWLSRREYNPFLWRAWLLMGKAQFQKGYFDEAAATFSYMSRLYATQPAIYGIARAWQAKSYVQLGWLYDAEDLIVKMRRDTMHYRARTDWDYTLADYYLHSGQYAEAVGYLKKVIKHEKRRKQRAREWFLMGQLQAQLGNRELAYKAFRKVIGLNPPYELEFNARIAQTEVMAKGQAKQMIGKLRRMARSDNNKDYLDQVYYAIGNIYLAERDTMRAIYAYEEGNNKAVRSGIEKGVLLLRLGDLYWAKEKYNDAQRCYGEAIGLLDKERPDYQQLSDRSRVLDELVPHTDAVSLQDSLQVLASLSEAERNKAIDRVIEELKKKEKEERAKAQEAEVERTLQRQGAVGNRATADRNVPAVAGAAKGGWYFYNPVAVSQGKTAFQRQWGKRENVDNWQRLNQTVVNLAGMESGSGQAAGDSVALQPPGGDMPPTDSTAVADSAANDPHKREYYLAQIPFTDEQKAASNDMIKEGLFHSGVIFKDKLDNLKLSEKALVRLTGQYADYGKNDEAWYHLFLLYSRQGNQLMAAEALNRLKTTYPESQWTVLLSDPYFVENAKFGVHIEDSLYAATYDAFKADRYGEVRTNARLSRERFPLGDNRPKFIFIEGLGMLNDGNAAGCIANMKEVVEKYPQSEVTEMAGMIVKGVQEGRRLHGGKFDLGDVWSRRGMDAAAGDSAAADTLSKERNTGFVFLLAYRADSIDSNQLLYEVAKYNFTNFMVRNFDIGTDEDNGISRIQISGFRNYDEALQYARMLYAVPAMAKLLQGCRRIIISEENLKLLGTRYSYVDYERFFEKAFAPLRISDEPLLILPASVEQERQPEPPAGEDGRRPEQQDGTDMPDGLLPGLIQPNAPVKGAEDDLFGVPAAGLPIAAPVPPPNLRQQLFDIDAIAPGQKAGQGAAQQQGNAAFDVDQPAQTDANAPNQAQGNDFDVDQPAPPANKKNTADDGIGADFDEDFYR